MYKFKSIEERDSYIMELLERYFKAQTTIAEEYELLCYFREPKTVPNELIEIKILFIGIGILATGGENKTRRVGQIV